MKNENKNSAAAISLRQKAEEKLIKKQAAPLADGDILKLNHELEVHQVELELQNEELRIAIDKAEEATEKITLLYDFAPAGYFTLDKDGLIKELNLNGAKMLGKERSSLLKNDFKQFISRDTRNIFLDFYQQVLKTGLKQTCDVWLTLNASPSSYYHFEGLLSENNHDCLITAIDITERKQAEDALKEKELHLRELNATKDKFFSIIAHDLRGPFTSIVGFADLLVDKLHSSNYDGLENYAKIIQKSSWRAMNLLKNLLEWSRLQVGNISINPKPLEISKLINEVTDLLEASAQQKSITISKEIPEDITVTADKDMINSIVRNLISNAIKFTYPKGKVVISAQQNQNEITVVVRDNGVGIEKNSIKNLFLIEGNQATRGTHNEEGTGIGLILCKEFILRHNGKIWVESRPGKGSTFYFTIPKN